MIPKIIHYCWFGKNPLPEKNLKCIESWKKYCPDYEIREWNESNYDFTQNEYIHQAYLAKKWAFITDFVRLDVIYRYGGIYMDTDVELVKSLDPLLQHQAYAGMENEAFIALGLGFGAEPGVPALKELLDFYQTLEFQLPDGSYNMVPSPQYTTRLLAPQGIQPVFPYQEIKGMAIYPAEFFSPKDFKTNKIKKTKNTYSIHHFDASWMTEAQRKALQQQHRYDRIKKRYGSFCAKVYDYIYWKKEAYGVCGMIRQGIKKLLKNKGSLSDPK